MVNEFKRVSQYSTWLWGESASSIISIFNLSPFNKYEHCLFLCHRPHMLLYVNHAVATVYILSCILTHYVTMKRQPKPGRGCSTDTYHNSTGFHKQEQVSLDRQTTCKTPTLLIGLWRAQRHLLFTSTAGPIWLSLLCLEMIWRRNVSLNNQVHELVFIVHSEK